MKRAFALLAVSLVALGCGGDAAGAAAKTPADAAIPPADPPADAAPADTAAAASKPAGEADEGAWAGEAEAKNGKTAEGNAKTETRTMDVIAQIVKDNRQPVRDCMDKVQKQLPDLAGTMVIHFVVDPDGKVTKAELNLERSTVKNAEVSECAVKVILGLKFPPSSRAMKSEVNYPYDFKKKQ
jgi:TonB family protein